ncbi:MAG: M50 family metallopeptidase, partial [Burkholderiaceae bacterium]|nr:M50 family metallopeptidase [Burkholderiaceae bacterium]
EVLVRDLHAGLAEAVAQLALDGALRRAVLPRGDAVDDRLDRFHLLVSLLVSHAAVVPMTPVGHASPVGDQVWRDIWHDIWQDVVGTQPPPGQGSVLLTGLLALGLVVLPPAWQVSRHVVTIAHEGSHGVAALLSGRRLAGIRLHSDTSGLTVSKGRPTGPGMVVTAFAGYVGPALLGLGALLAFAPPVFGLPLAAYAAVGCVLIGGIACVPATVALLLRAAPPPQRALPLLAVERARRERQVATIAVAGVVASLALAVALTVMVASFRDSMTRWLDSVLPAALYVRAGGGGTGASFLAPDFVRAVEAIPGVERIEAQRVTQVQLDPARPAVTLIARPLADAAASLPLVGALVPAAPGTIPVYVSEAMQALYGATPGSTIDLPLPDGRLQPLRVRGVWRDYARQQGTLLLAASDYRALTADARVNDLALWLAPDADIARVQLGIRALAGDAAIDFATTGEIRAISLRIFDRSFAVTTWLQAVAIAIGLVGIAASFSAQVLARRKEFGLLSHLGLTRRQIVAVVTAEGAVWTAAGTLLGLLLGLAVSVILVKVVNPQSFHWTMELALPALRLALLCGAVVVAGSATAWLASRALAATDLALAVKEDW